MHAAIQAIEFAKARAAPFRLWIDNQYVVKWLKFLANVSDYVANINKPNHDLLQQLCDVLQQAKSLYLGAVKVCSHQDITTATDSFERWVFSGNHSANELAAYEFCNHTELMQVREKLVEEISDMEAMRTAIHHVFLKVGKLALLKTR